MRRHRTGDPTRAVGYLRVSTDEQHLGPEAQRAAITQWAQRGGITVLAWHVDAGVSGAAGIDGRPALMTALDDLPRHGAGILAVAKRDRLARDVVIAATIERAVLAYTDAMTLQVQVPDHVFAAVSALHTAPEIVEITATIAAYNMVSRFLEALQIHSHDPR